MGAAAFTVFFEGRSGTGAVAAAIVVIVRGRSTAGTITDVIFLGDVVRYSARCDRGAALLFAQRREPGGGAHAVGARVAFAIDPSDVVFLTE